MTTEDPGARSQERGARIFDPESFDNLVVGFFHGILSGRTDEGWIKSWYRSVRDYFAEVYATLTVYHEYPLPRVAALRNRSRVARLVRSMAGDILHVATLDTRPPVYLFGHSNGGVLALNVAEGLADLGHYIDGVCLMAPALRSGDATRRLVALMEAGRLDRALLVRATGDKALGIVARMKIVCWPWGALGLEGWRFDEIPARLLDRFETIDLPTGHSDFLQPGNGRARTFETIALPFMRAEQREVAA